MQNLSHAARDRFECHGHGVDVLQYRAMYQLA